MTRRRLVALSPLDETLLIWQDAAVPWNAQIGIAAPSIDPVRAADAINAAMAVHPLTRCFIDADERGRPWWTDDSSARIGPIPVVECATDDDLEVLRTADLARPLPMDQAPLMRAAVARGVHADVLVLTVSHVLTDGLGLLRLARSIGRRYRGADDPSPAVDIATAQRALDTPPPSSIAALTQQWTTRLKIAATQLPSRSRLATSGGSAEGGFGFVLASVDLSTVHRQRQAKRASFDPYAMAALHVAIEVWNAEHAAPCDRIGVSQGVNLRPDAWWDDCVLNLATIASIVTDQSDRADIDQALTRVAPQLDPARRSEYAREVAASARTLRLLPRATRRDLVASLPEDRYDTCAISNCGALSDAPRFDDIEQPVAWIITPAMPAAGLTIATYAVADRLHFSACYRRERFDAAGATRFIAEFVRRLETG